ncbi:hypothetical protein M977_04312 [Buttiauxella gaviniae ATCC 51604]|uniref:Antirepressor protein C-terminal domain-containing protein n=1 Tax=Buttiauxella gaviniae ATCC 51604 TaxID=1354253 RepID=A0A1B7HN56_9ENTR|nr:phage antirepressor KilAC domain-containing protein [Buttiauxella gaviniae]OAT17066.1 hypothetical protein M977_04312 [Buttiauxella gaviniae ATCC 51604]
MNNLTLVTTEFFTTDEVIEIGGKAFLSKYLNGEPVMTARDLIQILDCTEDAFKHHLKRDGKCLIQGEDFHHMKGDELNHIKKKFNEINGDLLEPNWPYQNLNKTNQLNLFTRSGVDVMCRLVDPRSFVWSLLKSNYFDVPQEPAFKVPETFAEALFLAGKLEAERVQLALENKEKEALLVKQEAEHEMFVDNFFDESSTISIGTFAKITGVLGQKRMFAYLRDSGVMMASRNEPYQKYMHHFVIRGQFSTPLLKCTSAKWLLTRMAKDNLISTSKKDMCYDNIKAKYSDDLDVALEAAFKAA